MRKALLATSLLFLASASEAKVEVTEIYSANQASSGIRARLDDVIKVDQRTFVVVGREASPADNAFLILVTKNFGKTWEKITYPVKNILGQKGTCFSQALKIKGSKVYWLSSANVGKGETAILLTADVHQLSKWFLKDIFLGTKEKGITVTGLELAGDTAIISGTERIEDQKPSRSFLRFVRPHSTETQFPQFSESMATMVNSISHLGGDTLIAGGRTTDVQENPSFIRKGYIARSEDMGKTWKILDNSFGASGGREYLKASNGRGNIFLCGNSDEKMVNRGSLGYSEVSPNSQKIEFHSISEADIGSFQQCTGIAVQGDKIAITTDSHDGLAGFTQLTFSMNRGKTWQVYVDKNIPQISDESRPKVVFTDVAWMNDTALIAVGASSGKILKFKFSENK